MMIATGILLEFAIGLILVVAAFAFTAWYRYQRLKQASALPPPGYEATDEINIDPTTGIRQRVWFNPRTGERYYQKLDS
ncbi:MAG: hypothetical protein A2201_01820 [Alicyclobacillus sp. RIFOXYA1_FULL_53_8]|nr:MAG: hypothetical protein A2201_01820 [Alicyclobacillus sp. RIFOXYA1_FULL_53_8]